jgi:hypothetical protein
MLRAATKEKKQESERSRTIDRRLPEHEPHPCLAGAASRSSQRRAVAALQSTLGNQAVLRRLQRKCACGAVSGSDGECAECREKKSETTLQRAVLSPEPVHSVPPSVEGVLRSPGQPLDENTRTAMEERLGRNFRDVRVHADAPSAESARAVNALAYTVGNDVVFGEGRYDPNTHDGRRLLAHELVHVVQQGIAAPASGSALGISEPGDASEREAETIARAAVDGSIAFPLPVASIGEAGRLHRATFQVGSLTINIDYDDVALIPASDFQSAIETRFTAWTSEPASVIHSLLTGLSTTAKERVLFGLDLLDDNTTAAHAALDRVEAVKRLITQAPLSSLSPRSGSFDFEREVLRVSGWFEVALTSSLSAPTGTTLTDITTLYNPPSPAAAPPSGALDAPRLKSDLPPVVKAVLDALDPLHWSSKGTEPIGTLRTIADVVQTEARTFFSPYADTAMTNAYSSGWQYSAHAIDVTAAAPTPDLPNSFISNRAELIGRLPPAKITEALGKLGTAGAAALASISAILTGLGSDSIFAICNVDLSRPADQTALESIVNDLEKVTAVSATVDRLIRHTGRTDPASAATAVNLSTEFDAGTQTACEARYENIRTLVHELIHVLVHPNFPNRATSIKFGQIVAEGATDALTVQFFNSLVSKVGTDPAFKGQVEAGISPACPAPSATTVRYGESGKSSETILSKVGDDNFRAAYFLGRVNLVGL